MSLAAAACCVGLLLLLLLLLLCAACWFCWAIALCCCLACVFGALRRAPALQHGASRSGCRPPRRATRACTTTCAGEEEEGAPPGPDGFTDEAAAERDRAEQERSGEPAPALAPALCWRPAQVAADLALAKQLMASVDKEKGVTSNPLLPRPAAAGGEGEGEGAAGEAAAGGAEQAPAAEGEAAAAEGGAEQAPAAEGQQQQQQAAEEEGSGPADMDAELSPEEQLAKLDQVGRRSAVCSFSAACCAACCAACLCVNPLPCWPLGAAPAGPAARPASPLGLHRPRCLASLPMGSALLPQPEGLFTATLQPSQQVLAYLWRVHGIDFYGGREFTNPAERGRAVARRTRRGPKPSEADLAAADAAADAAGGSAKEAAAGGEGEAAEGGAGGEGAAEGAAAAEGGEGATAAAEGAKSPAAGGGGAAAAAGQAAEQGGAAEEDAREYERRVSGFWRYRIEKGDPLEGPLQRKRVRFYTSGCRTACRVAAGAGRGGAGVPGNGWGGAAAPGCAGGSGEMRFCSHAVHSSASALPACTLGFPCRLRRGLRPSSIRRSCPPSAFPHRRLRRGLRPSSSPRSSRLTTRSGATS